MGDDEHQPVGWQLGEGEHALISGPGRSGKSTALMAAAQSIISLHGSTDLELHTLAPRPSPVRHLDSAHHHGDAAELADALRGTRIDPDARRTIIALVDDADLTDDPTGALAALLARRIPGLWLFATGRPDGLRASYTHWTVPLRRSRQGLALRPQQELDGELWLTPLPRRTRHSTPLAPGRGYLVCPGTTELIQVAHPDGDVICR